MQSDIAAPERDLQGVKGQRSDELQDVREELNEMRQEFARLENVNRDNWWQATVDRVDVLRIDTNSPLKISDGTIARQPVNAKS